MSESYELKELRHTGSIGMFPNELPSPYPETALWGFGVHHERRRVMSHRSKHNEGHDSIRILGRKETREDLGKQNLEFCILLMDQWSALK